MQPKCLLVKLIELSLSLFPSLCHLLNLLYDINFGLGVSDHSMTLITEVYNDCHIHHDIHDNNNTYV
jgi:hypothetical protein